MVLRNECEVFVVGSLHMDVVVNAPHLPQIDETVTGSQVAYQFGGKGGNQAVAAARLGAKTAMAGRVGRDEFGGQLLEHLKASGVEIAQVQQGFEASGMSVAVVNKGGNYGAVIVSAANLEIVTEQIEFPENAQVLLLQNEIPEAVNINLAQRAKAAGTLVVMNAAPARAMSNRCLALVDVLIVNRVEAASMSAQYEDRFNSNEAAKKLLKKGPKMVIVTLGAKGLICKNADGENFEQAAYGVDVISTHGAGDSFIGALAAQLAKNVSIKQGLMFAQAAAALHVSCCVDIRGSVTTDMVCAFMAERAAN